MSTEAGHARFIYWLLDLTEESNFQERVDFFCVERCLFFMFKSDVRIEQWKEFKVRGEYSDVNFEYGEILG